MPFLAERTNATPVAVVLSDFGAFIRHIYDTTIRMRHSRAPKMGSFGLFGVECIGFQGSPGSPLPEGNMQDDEA